MVSGEQYRNEDPNSCNVVAESLVSPIYRMNEPEWCEFNVARIH